jgi:hypothetical protein
MHLGDRHLVPVVTTYRAAWRHKPKNHNLTTKSLGAKRKKLKGEERPKNSDCERVCEVT